MKHSLPPGTIPPSTRRPAAAATAKKRAAEPAAVTAAAKRARTSAAAAAAEAAAPTAIAQFRTDILGLPWQERAGYLDKSFASALGALAALHDKFADLLADPVAEPVADTANAADLLATSKKIKKKELCEILVNLFIKRRYLKYSA